MSKRVEHVESGLPPDPSRHCWRELFRETMALEEFWLLAVDDCLPPEIVILLLDVAPILPTTNENCFESINKRTIFDMYNIGINILANSCDWQVLCLPWPTRGWSGHCDDFSGGPPSVRPALHTGHFDCWLAGHTWRQDGGGGTAATISCCHIVS